MGDRIMFHLKNTVILIGIMYIFLIVKNILQILFGLLTSYTDVEPYTIYNIKQSSFSLAIIIFMTFLLL